MGHVTQYFSLAIGWLLVGCVCLQTLVSTTGATLRRVRRRREYERERAEFCHQIEVTARAARATHAIADWSGWRAFRVAAVVDEAHDTKSFYFTPVDGQPLAPFAPGQYLTFRLPVAKNEAPVVRCYSLSDRPRPDYFRSTIKRIGPPAGKRRLPPGRGSNYFHDRVQVGDVLDVRAPAGTFLIDPLATEPIVLIGAGIGITPLVSMLEAIVHAGRRREVYALFGFRNGREHPLKEYMKRLADSYRPLHLHISYSSPAADDVLYKDYNHKGRLSLERIQAVLPSSNFHFYVCGPGSLMESLVPALWQWGVPESHVHFEAFGPASVKSATAGQHRKQTAPCEVRFERTGRTLKWDGSLASLLEFGEAAGIAMPSGCRAGSCGECMIPVRSGSTTTVKQPGITVPAGHCLACISVPAGELVLDA